jgi:hypothetical protein
MSGERKSTIFMSVVHAKRDELSSLLLLEEDCSATGTKLLSHLGKKLQRFNEHVIPTLKSQK